MLCLHCYFCSRVNSYNYKSSYLVVGNLNWERRALSVRANMVARRFFRCTVPVKLTLFKAYCTSLYSGSLWFSYTQKAYNALRIQYNNAFRVLLCLPRFCSASSMFVTHTHLSLLNRLRGSPNSILHAVAGRFDSPLVASLVKCTLSLFLVKY